MDSSLMDSTVTDTTGTDRAGTDGTPMTGARAVIRSLETAGVEVVFGHPGGAILPAYDPIVDSPIRHVLARHEQGAGHMAEGYAQATGRVGVAIATSGPGGTNMVTPLANALMDSIPLVVITGQVATSAVGGDAFQEADITGITMPVTKHNEMVGDPDRIPGAIAEAFHIASTGRKGPVLIDIPKDVLASDVTTFEWPERISLPGYKPTVRGHSKMVREAVDTILAAEAPVVYAGGGILAAGAETVLAEFVEALNLPVVTTLMARGAFPDSHPQHLGMPGMHGHWTAVTAMQKADLLIALGTRFDDRVTGSLDDFAPGAKIVHVDIDPAEIGKNKPVDVPIVGDVATVLGQLMEVVAKSEASRADLSGWWATLRGWLADHPLTHDQQPDGPLKPQTVVRALNEARAADSIIVTGVGQHQMWASQLIDHDRPRSWINSGGLGTMGYGVPASIGAKVGRPDAQVILIDGDGSFQMTLQELATARTEGIPVIFTVLNNGVLGMVRQWQELFYDRRFSQIDLAVDVPDLVKLAEAFGCRGFRVEKVNELGPTLEKALAVTDVPVVIDFRIDPEEKVFPMVPAGQSNDAIIENMDQWRARTAAAARGDAEDLTTAGPPS